MNAETSEVYGDGVPGDADIAAVGKLIGDGARAAMLIALLDGHYRTAGELARAAGVSPSTASEHLSRLLSGGLVGATSQGRHRYFRLASADVAVAVEALAYLAPNQPVNALRQARASEALRSGRTCYDHLAGGLGVALTDALVRCGVLDGGLTIVDLDPLADLRLDVEGGRPRPMARPCLDWTERRSHVAGRFPAALLKRLLELGWLYRLGEGRAVALSADGQQGLLDVLGVLLGPPGPKVPAAGVTLAASSQASA